MFENSIIRSNLHSVEWYCKVNIIFQTQLNLLSGKEIFKIFTTYFHDIISCNI